MNIKFLTDEDFVNYKKASMFIGFPKCTFKCEKDCGIKMCQNGTLIHEPNIQITADKIVERYMNNPITNAIVVAGLEPFDSWDDLLDLVQTFRKYTDDDIVIYTGYYKNEILSIVHQTIGSEGPINTEINPEIISQIEQLFFPDKAQIAEQFKNIMNRMNDL